MIAPPDDACTQAGATLKDVKAGDASGEIHEVSGVISMGRFGSIYGDRKFSGVIAPSIGPEVVG